MKKTLYVAPKMELCGFAAQEMVLAVSVKGTNIEGLSVDNTPSEEEGLVKGIW